MTLILVVKAAQTQEMTMALLQVSNLVPYLHELAYMQQLLDHL